MFTKNMRAGYQGRRDEMRERADQCMNHPGHAMDVYFSKSAADFDKIRPYKEGGHIKQRAEVMEDIRDFKERMERHKQKMHHKKMEHLEDKKEKEMKKDKKCKMKEGGYMDEGMKMKKGGCMKMKDGGRMEEKKKKDCVQRFAMGGVAKMRHDEADKKGMPTKPKKGSVREIM